MANRPRPLTMPSPSRRNERRPEGLLARDCAVAAIFAVITDGRSFNEAFERAAATRPMQGRDRAFARAIATTVLRRHGELRAVIDHFLEKPLPEKQGRLVAILLSGAAQLIYLDTPPHAAISLAVDQCHGDRAAHRFDKLVNAVLRRVSSQGRSVLDHCDPIQLNVPDWLWQRWQKNYGSELARQIADASLCEPALDLTVKGEPASWAAALGGIVLPTGSVRLTAAGRVEDLPGYIEGEWWVQDAAAALPVKLMGDVANLKVLELCAAPGGKTAQLATAGARVTAVDKSAGRLKNLRSNLQRLGLSAETRIGNAATLSVDELFDAVLVDAPCTATGTIRRHPDILHLKRSDDISALSSLQEQILRQGAAAVKPGGLLVYCTCSLEPEEGEEQVQRFLGANPSFVRLPLRENEAGIDASMITPKGDLRTLPCHLADLADRGSGIDGFFATRLQKQR